MKEIDASMFVTRNLKIIEMLKSQLLSHIADLYAGMNDEGCDVEKRNEIFVNLIIINYVLAARLGFGAAALDMDVVKKLKIGVLDDNNAIHDEVVELLRHFKGRV